MASDYLTEQGLEAGGMDSADGACQELNEDRFRQLMGESRARLCAMHCVLRRFEDA